MKATMFQMILKHDILASRFVLYVRLFAMKVLLDSPKEKLCACQWGGIENAGASL